MAKIMSAAPIDAAAVLPNVLIDQYVKPAGAQTALLDAFRKTAIDWIEGHTAKSLARRQWTAAFDGFGEALLLPREPVRSVVAVDYVDLAGATVVGGSFWQQDGSQIGPSANGRWPAASTARGSVLVTFEAGFDDVGSEAPGLQVATLMLVKHLYDGGSLKDVPDTVLMLVDEPHRTPVMA
ncbi:hypothetical protein ACFSGX_13955 [Sphingomonas arantia]|uniref:Phage gp6-like head-tail connector protein n=1 Tax=Sphingomonas arantia TaxID=1460676 RepID=A0ABW4U0M1_9SPHN